VNQRRRATGALKLGFSVMEILRNLTTLAVLQAHLGMTLALFVQGRNTQ
jgi:hypothetical protein